MDNKYLNTASAYHDVSGLQRLRTGAKNNDNQALEAVAKQLEGTFLNMMLKSMREANSMFGEGNPLNSKEAQFYQGMFDQQISLTMAEGKGIGLADVIVKQMQGINQADHKLKERLEEGLPFGTSDKLDKLAKPLKQDSRPFLLGEEPEAYKLPVDESSNALPIDRVRSMIPSKSALEVPKKELVDEPAGDKSPGIEPVAVEPVAEIVPAKIETALRTVFPTVAAFVDTITPYAKAAANELGIDVNAIVAQAALETGWGNHMIENGDGKSSYNFFGIKSSTSWSGDSARVNTLEYRDGVAAKESAQFRSYKSMDEAFQDYVSFLRDNPRYKDALENTNTAKDWGFQLQRAGYATDPNYGKKIAGIVSRLDRSDKN